MHVGFGICSKANLMAGCANKTYLLDTALDASCHMSLKAAVPPKRRSGELRTLPPL
jgi:hypothetical protein